MIRKASNTFIKILAIIAVVLSVFVLVSCKNSDTKDASEIIVESVEMKNSEAEALEEMFDFEKNYKDRKVVVAYFSATGNTKKVAEKIAEIFKCDAVAIEPKEPYTDIDLTSNDPSTRPMRESMFDPFNPPEEPEEDTEVDESIITSLPAIKRKNFNRYDTIILGYPIWYSDAPRVIYTFVSENNLKDKVIIPFCTSDNDGIDLSVNNLAAFSNGNFMSGKRFDVSASDDEIKAFFAEIGVDIDAWD